MCVYAAPSLASYDHILAVFYKSGSPAVVLIRDPHRYLRCLLAACFKCAFTPCVSSPASSAQNNTDILQEVIAELEGRVFTCQDPDDGSSRRTTDLANVSFCLGRTNVWMVNLMLCSLSVSAVLFFSSAMRIVSPALESRQSLMAALILSSQISGDTIISHTL